jgi:ATP-binding cassette, subfamily B, bacterial
MLLQRSDGQISHGQIARWLLPYALRYRGRLLIGIAALAITGVGFAAIGQVAESYLSNANQLADGTRTIQAISVLFAIALLIAASVHTRIIAFGILGERIIADLRQDLFHIVLQKDYLMLRGASTGALVSRIVNDTAALSGIVIGVASFALRNLVLVLTGAAMMLVTAPVLFLATFVVSPAFLMIYLRLARGLQQKAVIAQDAVTDMNGGLTQILHGLRTVRMQNLNASVGQIFSAASSQVRDRISDRIRQFAMLMGATQIMIFGGAAIYLGASYLYFTRFDFDLPAFVGFTYYLGLYAFGLAALAQLGGEISRSVGIAERILEWFADRPVGALVPPLTDIDVIELRHVTFHYPPPEGSSPEPVLTDVSLTARKGQIIGISGASGVGKSTLLDILGGIVAPTEGDVVIWPHGAATWINDAELRRSAALLDQHAAVFDTSGSGNLRIGNPDWESALPADAVQHLSLTHLVAPSDTEERHVSGYSAQLSGGERQRIAFLRALAAPHSILILDEPTSALDAGNEAALMELVQQASPRRIIFLVTHNPKLRRYCSDFYAIQDGRLVRQIQVESGISTCLLAGG